MPNVFKSQFGVTKFLFLLLALFISSCSSEYKVVVVHPEKQFIGSEKIAKEVSTLRNVTLVVSEENAELITEIHHSQKLISGNGVIGIDYPKVEFAGGYFSACLKNAIMSWSENRAGKGGTAIINMRYVYSGRFRTLYQEYDDNYKRNTVEFLDYLKTQTFRGLKAKLSIDGDYIIIALD